MNENGNIGNVGELCLVKYDSINGFILHPITTVSTLLSPIENMWMGDIASAMRAVTLLSQLTSFNSWLT